MLRRAFAFCLLATPLAAQSGSRSPAIDSLLSLQSVGSPALSPDGQRVAYLVTATDWAHDAFVAQLWVQDLRTGKAQQLTRHESGVGQIQWSPDGDWLAFTSTRVESRSQIFAIALDGGEPVRLTNVAGGVSAYVDWGARGVYFGASQHTASHLFVVDPSTGAVTRVTGPDSAMLSGFSLSHDQSSAAFTLVTPSTLPEVAVSPLSSFAPHVVTLMSTQIREWKLGTREVVRWKSRDGTEIEGILVKPRDFDPAKKYPLLCVIHGGPTAIDRPVLSDARYYPVDEWVNRGALVLKVNYRGSAGYGERFRALNYRNLGVGDAWDVLSGVDALIANGLRTRCEDADADPAR